MEEEIKGYSERLAEIFNCGDESIVETVKMNILCFDNLVLLKKIVALREKEDGLKKKEDGLKKEDGANLLKKDRPLISER